VSALVDPQRLAGLIAQLDQGEAMRDMVMRRISDHLARNGQKFVDLAAAIESMADEAPEPLATAPATRAKPVPNGPYIHKPLVSKRFGRWPSTVRGKTVVRKTRPPVGMAGRFRVLKDESIDGLHRVTCSLETEHEIYEPFHLHFDDEDEMAGIVVECSANGKTLRF
jgi:hypothetical protein